MPSTATTLFLPKYPAFQSVLLWPQEVLLYVHLFLNHLALVKLTKHSTLSITNHKRLPKDVILFQVLWLGIQMNYLST